MLFAFVAPATALNYDFSAVAPSGQTLYYNIIGPGEVEVTNQNGDQPYYSTYPTGDLTIPAGVEYESTAYSVTSIGDYAFFSCSGLISVNIPNSVTSIGYEAFDYCNGLTSVSISNSVTSIGDYAFEYCYGLISVTIPNSVTSIGSYAFAYCFGLTSINIPNSVTSIGNGAFYGCFGITSVSIPNSVTSIGEGAFCVCSGLTSIYVESDNTVYDSRESCNAIIETATNTLVAGCMNTIIPNTVASIGGAAFYQCSELTSINIPNSISSVESLAFAECVGLTSINIPNSVTSISGDAFYGCEFTSISVESSNMVYDSREDCNAIIETATNTLIAGCMNTVIPNSVSSIGYKAFKFCTGLTSIIIPNSVTSIGANAFEYCIGLNSIECLSDIPPSVGWSAFWGVTNNIPVYVPCGKVAAYRAAEGWSSFTNIQEVGGCIPAGPTNIAVYADGNAIVVEGATGNTVTLYDNNGNTLATSIAPAGTPLRFEALDSGTYFIKIVILPARMKVEVQ